MYRVSSRCYGLALFSKLKRRLSTCTEAKVNMIELLRGRGLIKQVSQPEEELINKLKNNEILGLYCGADPTAKSLHIGNLLPLMVLLHFYVNGYTVYPLIGGATGKVGDPSGRSTARKELDEEVRAENIKNISKQFRNFFRNGWDYYLSRNGNLNERQGRFIIVNNYDWWREMGILDFLHKYGGHIRIQSMLSRDSIASRFQSKDGVGFNEFTYQLLQAFDFYHLYKNHRVQIQVGGNDQWGNITAGIDLINRISPDSRRDPPFGITVPLLTTSSGEKFGKSAGNAVFIDPNITTPFKLYQYFFNVEDKDLEKLLKIFTMLSLETIDSILKEHNVDPSLRKGQKQLAREVVDLIHGVDSSKDAELVSDILFSRAVHSVSAANLIKLFKEAHHLYYASRDTSLVDLISTLVNCSRKEARRKLSQGSIYLGPYSERVDNATTSVEPYLIDSTVLILRVGKQQCFVVQLQ